MKEGLKPHGVNRCQMAKMVWIEKLFVNRRGESSFVWIADALEKSGAAIPPSPAILDIGAGNGAFAALLYDRYHPSALFAIDVDPAQAKLAEKRLRGKYGKVPDGLKVEVADAVRMPYPDGQFDLVTAHLVLHHLGKDLAAGVSEVFRVLKPGGIFLYVEGPYRKQAFKAVKEAGFTPLYRSGGHREAVISAKTAPGSQVSQEPS
ncbi:MAG: class I SAM-dependent methyltransferase [Nitrososphaerota archaeon]|nr:class I SAM-dependent methyltransferase [Nitrososphaerota archaeon]